jgi:hypothetical protein
MITTTVVPAESGQAQPPNASLGHIRRILPLSRPFIPDEPLRERSSRAADIVVSTGARRISRQMRTARSGRWHIRSASAAYVALAPLTPPCVLNRKTAEFPASSSRPPGPASWPAREQAPVGIYPGRIQAGDPSVFLQEPVPGEFVRAEQSK